MTSAPVHKIDSFQESKVFQGMRIGRIVGVDPQGVVYVDFQGNDRGPLAARLTGTMRSNLEDLGWSAVSQVLLLFEETDPARPVVIDVIVGTVRADTRKEPIALQVDKGQEEVTMDGKSVTFNAQEQIVLKCGKASITLTKAGKVLIRGAYLLNRSSGVNKIKGGSVQIN